MIDKKEHIKKAKKLPQLRTPKDGRRILSVVLNMLTDDEISTEKAKTICTIINSFQKSFEIDELEKQVNQIKLELEKLK